MVEYLLGQPDFVREKIVLELGAGTGSSVCYARNLGRARSILTDNDRRSLIHMESDIPLNNCGACVCSLDWFEGFNASAMRDMLGASVQETPDSLHCGR